MIGHVRENFDEQLERLPVDTFCDQIGRGL